MTGIRLEPAATVLTAGQTVRCTADGQPPPRYRWIRLRDNVEVSSNETLNVGVDSAGDDHTSYMCVASNSVDDDTETHVYSQHVYFTANSRLHAPSFRRTQGRRQGFYIVGDYGVKSTGDQSMVMGCVPRKFFKYDVTFSR